MGWWTSGDEILWSYQYPFNETANGINQPLALHDRFALSLYADTRADKDAHWLVVSHPGRVTGDELNAAADNGTLQSWLVEATEAGSRDFTLKYVTSQPLPPSVADPSYVLQLKGEPGNWKITTVDETGDGAAAGAYPSLLIDRLAAPISVITMQSRAR